MIFIPSLFFSFILYKIIRKNGFDLSACITSMYLLISIFAAILGNYDYEFPYGNYSKVSIGIVPTFVYCFSIGICIYPFYIFNSNKKRTLFTLKHPKYVDLLVYVYFLTFLLLLAIFWKDILFRIFYGDMGELRQLQYAGLLENALDSKGGAIRRIGGLLTIIGDGAYFMIPIFFYALCKMGKSTLYLLMILLGSVTPVLLGFINIDRSKTAFWICIFLMTFFLFRPYINSEKKKETLKRLIIIVGGILLLYLTVVTISRFGERDEGTSGGLLVYLGQPFINFCNIWEHIDSNHFFISRVLPLTTFIFDGGHGNDEIVDYIMSSASRTGLHLNVFFTFVGMFLVDMGRIAAIVIPLFQFLISKKILLKSSKNHCLSIHDLLLVFSFAVVLQCGIIIYFYTTVPRVLAFWFFILYSKHKLK